MTDDSPMDAPRMLADSALTTRMSDTDLSSEVRAPTTPAKLNTIDNRSRLARVFKRTRTDVVQSLGGPKNISSQQAIAVRLLAEAEALRQALFADATRGKGLEISAYTSLAAVSQRSLKLVGMKRLPKDVPSLAEYMKTKSRSSGGPSAP